MRRGPGMGFYDGPSSLLPPPLCVSVTVTMADFSKWWQCDIFPTQMRPLPRPRAGPGEPPPPAFRYELASGRPPGSPEYAGARSRPPLATSDCSLRTSRPTALNPRPRKAGAGHAEGRANVRNTCPTGERVGKRASARWGREEMRGDLSHLLTHRNPASTCWLEKSVKSIYVKKPERRISLQVYSQDGPRPAGTFRTTHVVELKI